MSCTSQQESETKSYFGINFISEPTNWRGKISWNAPKEFFQQYRRIIKWIFSTLMEAALKMHSVATEICTADNKSGDKNCKRKRANHYPPQATKKKAKESKLDLKSKKIKDNMTTI